MANGGDIRRWLAEQGFAKYADTFVSNAIGLNVLSELTDADLKDIGITTLGDRKRLLKAIASVASADISSAVPTATPASSTDAERRQITVLFCDLVASTALASRLDAEDLRDVIRAYHKCCADIVAKYDGSVAQYLGDGVMVRFGYPKAHEDDADRAIRCGMEMIKAVGALKVPDRVEARSPRRHCNRRCRSRRSNAFGSGRDAKSRSPTAGLGRAGLDCHRGQHKESDW
jgi:hypothetical protein